MIRILAATLLLAVMGTIPAKAARYRSPIFRQCLCITPAGAWAMKPRGAKHKPCVIVCNATPQKRNIEITDISSSRRRAHARPFRGAHVDAGERGRGRHVRGAGGTRAAASEVFDNDGRVRMVAGPPASRVRVSRTGTLSRRVVRLAHAPATLPVKPIEAPAQTPEKPSPKSGLVTVATAAGIPITVAAALADRFVGFIADLVGQGYKPHSIGCYASKGHIPHSNHYVGAACDIDQRGRDLTTPQMRNVRHLADKWSLRDGCVFRDCGHVEVPVQTVRYARARHRYARHVRGYRG